MGKTLFDKIWDSHVITDLGNGFVLLHIDRLLLHDLSGARALQEAVEDQYQARAAGLLESAASAVPGIGFVVGGVLTAAVSPRAAYAVSAVGVAVVVAVWARRPIVPDRITV